MQVEKNPFMTRESEPRTALKLSGVSASAAELKIMPAAKTKLYKNSQDPVRPRKKRDSMNMITNATHKPSHQSGFLRQFI